MKKILLSSLIALAASTTLLPRMQKTLSKINPLSALFKTGSVFVEHKVAEKASIQLGVAYTGLKLSETKFSGFALTPEYRYYPKGNAVSGLYLAPYLRYQNYTLKDEMDNKGTFTSFGGGAMIGRQWVWNSGFALDIFFGPSYNSGKIKAEDAEGEFDTNAALDGFGIRTGIALGFGF